MTELALDDWLMQQYGIEMGNIPITRPSSIPVEVFDTFRKYYRMYQNNPRPISPRSRAILQPGLETYLNSLGEIERNRLLKVENR